MTHNSGRSSTKKHRLPPLWTQLSGQQRIAGLDVHSPSYLLQEQDPFGCGDIGALFELIPHLQQAGIRLLQLTPIEDTGDDANPYRSLGLCSYNPLYLSVSLLPTRLNLKPIMSHRTQALRLERQLDSSRFFYAAIRKTKLEILKYYYAQLDLTEQTQFEAFYHHLPPTTLAYAIFSVLKQKFQTPWYQWPTDLRKGDLNDIQKQYPLLLPEVRFICFTQWVMQTQWFTLAEFASKQGVYLSLDKAIYPMPDSSDVWANQTLFYLTSNGEPEYLSGCDNPGDLHGRQIWQHAIYRFAQQSEPVIDYFVTVSRHLAQVADAIRLDHTLALVWKYYLIDPKTQKGKHLPALKHRLLQRLKQELPHVFFYAEDVGYSSVKDVELPLAQNHIMGIRCLQWHTEPNQAQPKHYKYRTIAITSNHDLPSLWSWWKSLDVTTQRKIWGSVFSNTYQKEDHQIVPSFIKEIFASKAAIAMVTYRDLVEDSRRYNHPGKEDDHFWLLRSFKTLKQTNFSQLKSIIEHSGRMLKLLKTEPLLGLSPVPDEIQRRSPGECFTLMLALSHLPIWIEWYSNLYSRTLKNWTTHRIQISDPNLKMVSFDDGTSVCTLAIPIPKDQPRGSYELAANIGFADQIVSICEYQRNLQLEVW